MMAAQVAEGVRAAREELERNWQADRASLIAKFERKQAADREAQRLQYEHMLQYIGSVVGQAPPPVMLPPPARDATPVSLFTTLNFHS